MQARQWVTLSSPKFLCGGQLQLLLRQSFVIMDSSLLKLALKSGNWALIAVPALFGVFGRPPLSFPLPFFTTLPELCKTLQNEPNTGAKHGVRSVFVCCLLEDIKRCNASPCDIPKCFKPCESTCAWLLQKWINKVDVRGTETAARSSAFRAFYSREHYLFCTVQGKGLPLSWDIPRAFPQPAVHQESCIHGIHLDNGLENRLMQGRSHHSCYQPKCQKPLCTLYSDLLPLRSEENSAFCISRLPLPQYFKELHKAAEGGFNSPSPVNVCPALLMHRKVNWLNLSHATSLAGLWKEPGRPGEGTSPLSAGI